MTAAVAPRRKYGGTSDSVACLRVDLYTILDQGSRAIAVGLDYLRHLGIDWSPHPTEEEARSEYERIWSQLGSRTIEDLIELPLMTDPASLATIDVLTKLCATCTNLDGCKPPCSSIVCWAVNLSLEGGNSDAFVHAIIDQSAWSAGAQLRRLSGGVSDSASSAASSSNECGLKRLRGAALLLLLGAHLVPWTRHVRAGRNAIRSCVSDRANKSGDLTFATY